VRLISAYIGGGFGDTRPEVGAVVEIEHDLRDLRPRDFIDIQSFIWVLGSDEYKE